MPIRLFLPLLIVFIACESDEPLPEAPPENPAQTIVDQAIAEHGGAVLNHAIVEFDFREFHYTITRDGGMYRYERTFTDSTGAAIHDVLDNEGITRSINGEPVTLTPEETNRIATPLNSVPYFALLPYNLKDPAVQKRVLGEVVLAGEPYDKIEVTFQQAGGGRDFEDRFIYWFHRDHHTMDYLAYAFHVDDGGTRFREAYNVRTIGGVRFADYHNFVSDSLQAPGDPIERYDTLMEQTDLELLSDVVLENVMVRPLEQ